MPRGTIEKIDIDKKVFMSIVKQCKSSIIKLGECEEIECTERTIRRALNEGKMTPRFLDQIAKHLNVDSRLLSGELHKQAYSYKDDLIKNICLSQLRVEKHPYYNQRKSELNKQPIENLIEQILSLFEISFSQFEKMDFESQYALQHDLFDALIPVIRKHFEVDAYGQKDMPNLIKILVDLESYRDNHYEKLYAEEVLREKYLRNPPKGKTKADIRRMSADALIDLDMEEQWRE